jgi:hypothetical protein
MLPEIEPTNGAGRGGAILPAFAHRTEGHLVEIIIGKEKAFGRDNRRS